MKKSKSVLVIIGTAVFIMLTATACGMLAELEDGYNLVLTVQGQGNARGISVDYHDVTSMRIEVRQPENNILETFDWYPSPQTQQFVVNLGDTGTYHLKVTHFSEVGEVEKAAEEWATFEIRNYVITMINIVPGAVGAIVVEPPAEEPADDLEGLWFGSSVPYWDLSGFLDTYVWILPGNRFRSALYLPGESGLPSLVDYSMMGTYEIIDGVFYPTGEALYVDPDWISPPPPDFTPLNSAFELDGDTFTLYQDLSSMNGGKYTWIYSRVQPFCDPSGSWVGTGQESPHDFPVDTVVELREDGMYELIMHYGDPDVPLGFSTRGYWWIADGSIVLDAADIYLDEKDNHPGGVGWYSVSDIVPGMGWSCSYLCEDGQLIMLIDFMLDGSFIGEWTLAPAY